MQTANTFLTSTQCCTFWGSDIDDSKCSGGAAEETNSSLAAEYSRAGQRSLFCKVIVTHRRKDEGFVNHISSPSRLAAVCENYALDIVLPAPS